jgi:hypothetical protein
MFSRDDQAEEWAVWVFQVDVELGAFRQSGHCEREQTVVPTQTIRA